MRQIMKFTKKTGNYNIANSVAPTRCSGIYYLNYPFIIHRDMQVANKWSVTHLVSGYQVTYAKNLRVAKYIASRLFPINKFLLPNKSLVNAMSEEEKLYCVGIIQRYRDCKNTELESLDKYCPYSI